MNSVPRSAYIYMRARKFFSVEGQNNTEQAGQRNILSVPHIVPCPLLTDRQYFDYSYSLWSKNPHVIKENLCSIPNGETLLVR